jgi:hypothetical protein
MYRYIGELPKKGLGGPADISRIAFGLEKENARVEVLRGLYLYHVASLHAYYSFNLS